MLTIPRERGEQLDQYIHRAARVLDNYAPSGIMGDAQKISQLKRQLLQIVPRQLKWPIITTTQQTVDELTTMIKVLQGLAESIDRVDFTSEAIDAEIEQPKWQKAPVVAATRAMGAPTQPPAQREDPALRRPPRTTSREQPWQGPSTRPPQRNPWEDYTMEEAKFLQLMMDSFRNRKGRGPVRQTQAPYQTQPPYQKQPPYQA